jgi:hypothetical protein
MADLQVISTVEDAAGLALLFEGVGGSGPVCDIGIAWSMSFEGGGISKVVEVEAIVPKTVIARCAGLAF